MSLRAGSVFSHQGETRGAPQGGQQVRAGGHGADKPRARGEPGQCVQILRQGVQEQQLHGLPGTHSHPHWYVTLALVYSSAPFHFLHLRRVFPASFRH